MTPRRNEMCDTGTWSGAPVSQYLLGDGVGDGGLTLYRLHRIVTDVDVARWRPLPELRDSYGEVVPDSESGTAFTSNEDTFYSQWDGPRPINCSLATPTAHNLRYGRSIGWRRIRRRDGQRQ
jgi:hypothetical protein